VLMLSEWEVNVMAKDKIMIMTMKIVMIIGS
jgi:hypothetical protein